MQLDIFEHSRDVMLRNDVADAVMRRDAAGALAAWLSLAQAFPHDHALAALTVLIEALEHPGEAPFADHDDLRRTREALEQRVAPAAQQVFGTAAGSVWLVPLWRTLAQRAARLPFDPRHSEDHAAALWLHIGDWQAAADAAAATESWRRIPAPLAWMAWARHRLLGLDAAWPLLAELAWLAPGRFDRLVRDLPDPVLARLRETFDAQFEGSGELIDLAWFPAWVLTERPGLAGRLSKAQPSLHTDPERALRLMVELLGLEQQGRHHELIECRKRLRSLHAALFAAYMKTR